MNLMTGVEARTVATNRLRTHYYQSGRSPAFRW